MLVDSRLEFADDVDVAASAGTGLIGDVVDLGVARDIGQGQPLYLVIQVTTAFASGGSATVDFRLRSDGVAAIHDTTSTPHLSTGPLTMAQLAVGKRHIIPLPGEGVAYEQFLGVQAVTAAATTTAGSVNVFLTTEPPVVPTTSYPDAAN